MSLTSPLKESRQHSWARPLVSGQEGHVLTPASEDARFTHTHTHTHTPPAGALLPHHASVVRRTGSQLGTSEVESGEGGEGNLFRGACLSLEDGALVAAARQHQAPGPAADRASHLWRKARPPPRLLRRLFLQSQPALPAGAFVPAGFEDARRLPVQADGADPEAAAADATAAGA